jgi:hypothetical protein
MAVPRSADIGAAAFGPTLLKRHLWWQVCRLHFGKNSSFRSRHSEGVREQAAASTARGSYNFPRNLAPDFTHYFSEGLEVSSQ